MHKLLERFNLDLADNSQYRSWFKQTAKTTKAGFVLLEMYFLVVFD